MAALLPAPPTLAPSHYCGRKERGCLAQEQGLTLLFRLHSATAFAFLSLSAL